MLDACPTRESAGGLGWLKKWRQGAYSIDSYIFFNKLNRKNIHVIDGKQSKIYLLLYNALHNIVNKRYVNNKNYKYRQLPLGITEASFRLLSPFLRQVNLRCSDYTLSLYRGTSFRFTSLKRSLLHLFFVVHPLAEGDIVLNNFLYHKYQRHLRSTLFKLSFDFGIKWITSELTSNIL